MKPNHSEWFSFVEKIFTNKYIVAFFLAIPISILIVFYHQPFYWLGITAFCCGLGYFHGKLTQLRDDNEEFEKNMALIDSALNNIFQRVTAHTTATASKLPDEQFIYPQGITSGEAFGTPTITQDLPDIHEAKANLVSESTLSATGTVTPTITQELPEIHGESNITLDPVTSSATGTVTQWVSLSEVKDLISQFRDEILQTYRPTINTRKVGRPSYPDDIWAVEELRTGRERREVEKKWRARQGVVERNLQDPDRQFEKLVQKARSKGTDFTD